MPRPARPNRPAANPLPGEPLAGSEETLPLPAGEEAILAATQAATPQAPLNADAPALSYRQRNGLKSTRARVGTWLAMKAIDPTLTNIEVAKRMGITAGALNSYIGTARREGWLTFTDPLSRIEHEIIPKAIENLSSFLDAKDKQVTIEVAKGTVFKMFQESKGISEAPKTILALKIEMPPTLDGVPKVTSGIVVGVPRMIEVE